MKRFLMIWLTLLVVLVGCSRYKQMSPYATTPAPIVVDLKKLKAEETEPETELQMETIEAVNSKITDDTDAHIKGIYISAFTAGTATMETLIREIDRTEINTVVIDIKGDEGFVTCRMNSPIVTELGTVRRYIPEIETLMAELKAHDIYTIARIAAFRDPLMAEKKPEWCVLNEDGSVYLDSNDMAWINPYVEEAWDYLVEIGIEAKRLGFDEVQFDYIRFCTERGMGDVTFAEDDVQGRSKTEIITQFVDYAYTRLKGEGLFVSADVFGAIIGSEINANAVGQDYGELAKHLDYISPMIYPSHYADGNFGIEHPDMQPYETIKAALSVSAKVLEEAGKDGSRIAIVRPWLQDFTASYLENYIPYGKEQVRAQIQATYDSGYDEWLLWNASVRYTWEGILSDEEARKISEQSNGSAMVETWE